MDKDWPQLSSLPDSAASPSFPYLSVFVASSLCRSKGLVIVNTNLVSLIRSFDHNPTNNRIIFFSLFFSAAFRLFQLLLFFFLSFGPPAFGDLQILDRIIITTDSIVIETVARDHELSFRIFRTLPSHLLNRRIGPRNHAESTTQWRNNFNKSKISCKTSRTSIWTAGKATSFVFFFVSPFSSCTVSIHFEFFHFISVQTSHFLPFNVVWLRHFLPKYFSNVSKLRSLNRTLVSGWCIIWIVQEHCFCSFCLNTFPSAKSL